MKKLVIIISIAALTASALAQNSQQSAVYNAFLSCFQTNSSEKPVQIKDK